MTDYQYRVSMNEIFFQPVQSLLAVAIQYGDEMDDYNKHDVAHDELSQMISDNWVFWAKNG